MSNKLPVGCLAGAKQTRKAILNGTAETVLLATDADPALTEPLERLCAEHQVRVTWVSSMRELGELCALKVGAAAAVCPQPVDFSGKAR